MKDILKSYVALSDFFKESLGKYYDCFVLEYSDGELKLCESNFVESENLKNYYAVVLDAIRNNKESVINTISTTDNNKFYKISVKLIRENGKTVGAICLVFKCNPFVKMEGIINDFLNFYPIAKNQENYPLCLESINKYIDDFGISSTKLNKNEKTEIICDLFDMGMFDIKGAVQAVADKLGMSTKSVYRYITNVKEARE